MAHATHSNPSLRCIALTLGLLLPTGTAFAQELVEELAPDPAGYHKFFGDKLAVDGDTAVMGDYNYMREGSCGQQEHGAVQVFKKVGGSWQKTEFFRYLDDNDDIQRHGWSVAIKGNVIVASTPGQRWVNGGIVRLNAGALSVYKRPNASSPFTSVGQVFLPNPEENDFLGWPVDMASNGVYAAVISANHRADIRIFEVDPTPQYLTTITHPNGAWPWRMAITNQNILVADSGSFTAPFAWKLNGSQATPIDLSSFGNSWDDTTGALTGDGDSVAWIAHDNYSDDYLLRIAKFGASSVVSFTNQPMPDFGGGSLPMTLEEGQGLFAKAGDFVSAYKYVGDRYRYQGNLYHSPLNLVSLAFNGTDLLVGDRVPEHPSPPPCDTKHGSIWVYRPLAPTTPGPGVSTTLEPWVHTATGSSGASVAISGSFAVSTAPDTYRGPAPGGAVHLYQNVSGAWQQIEEYIDNYDGQWGVGWSGFGASVDINPNFIAIGVPGGMNGLGVQTGSVNLVRKVNGVFNSGPDLDVVESPSYEEWNEAFGTSVALSGNTLFVGAPAWSAAPGSPNAGGSVYVFTWEGFYWAYRQQLRNPNVQAYEGFGYRVSASGDNLIVGIPYRSTLGHSANGAVEIYRKDTTTGSYVSAGEFWAPSGLGDYANFGLSVSMSADFAAAGSPASSVVVYRRVGSTWSQHAGMPITSSQWGFGSSVAIQGGNLVVGSPWESRVHRYQRITFWGVSWWSLGGSLVGSTSSFGSSADMEGGLVSLGESYGAVGGRTVGATHLLNFSNIQ